MQLDGQTVWSLYANFPGAERPILLNPLSWRGGNQISNLREILNFLQNPDIPEKIKILIYRSQCGSGKSATLLHTIENMGRGIVVVPFKNLQRQYMIDYDKGENKFILKKNETKLKVSVILGRNNFPCLWLHEEYDKQQKLIAEAQKAGQIADVNDFILKTYQIDNSCANRFLPCTRTLKSLKRGRKEARWVVAGACPYWIPTPLPREIIYNWQMRVEGKEDIEDFYEEEEEYDYDYLSPYRKILGIDEESTHDDIDKQFRKLALRCHPDVNKSPWAEEQFKKITEARDILAGKDIIQGNQQLLKDKLEKERKCITRLDKIKERIKCSKIEYYDAVNGEKYGVFIRDEIDKEGKSCPQVCPYYKQFYSYIESDAIIMNDAKWNIETRIGRKPITDVEIMDEGDYWLDRQSETIEIKRFMIDKIYPFDEKIRQIKSETLYVYDTFFDKLKKAIDNQKENIVNAKEYKELFLRIAKCINEYLRYSDSDEKYEEILINLATIIKYIDKAHLSYIQGKRDETKIIKVYIPYPDNILKELFELSSKNIIITSGTMHSNFVLSNLFGINADNYNVQILDGRKDSPGKLICIKPQTGLARVTYSAYQSPAFREHYNKTLNYILDQLKIVIDKKTGKLGEGKILVLTPAKYYADGIRNRQDVFVDFARDKIKEHSTKTMINTNLVDYVDNTLVDVRKIKSDDIQLDGDVYRTPQQIIISTRLVRGADLRDDKCRAVVMTKWPTPDISDGYFQALLKRFGEKIYWAIIQDKAEREAIQYVSRGLRHDMDWEFFSSPDETAFNRIYTIFREMKMN